MQRWSKNVLADAKETRNGTPRTYPWRLGFRSNRIHRKVSRWFGPARDSSRAATIVACSMEKRSECKHWMTTTTKHSTVVATRTQRLRVKSVEENRSRSIWGSCWTSGARIRAPRNKDTFKSTSAEDDDRLTGLITSYSGTATRVGPLLLRLLLPRLPLPIPLIANILYNTPDLIDLTRLDRCNYSPTFEYNISLILT